MVFCTYCGQSFTRDEHLERHILTHTNIKPFKCFTCHMSFARRDLLQRHYTVHGKNQENGEGVPSIMVPKSAGRTPIACTNCAKTKTKCDKKFPCSRCASRNLKCILRPTRRVSRNVNRMTVKADGEASSSSSSAEPTQPGQIITPDGSSRNSPQPPISNPSPRTTMPAPAVDQKPLPVSTPEPSASASSEPSAVFFQPSPSSAASQHVTTVMSPLPTPGTIINGFMSSTPISGYDEFAGVSRDGSDQSSPRFMMDWTMQFSPPHMDSLRGQDIMMPAMANPMGMSMDGLADATMLTMIPEFAGSMGSLQTPIATPRLSMSTTLSELELGNTSVALAPSTRQTSMSGEISASGDLPAVIRAQDGWNCFRSAPTISPALCPKTAKLHIERLEQSLKNHEGWNGWAPAWQDTDTSNDHLHVVPLQEGSKDKLFAITQTFLHKALEVHRNTNTGTPEGGNSPYAGASNFVILPPIRVLTYFLRAYANSFEQYFPMSSRGTLDVNEKLMNQSISDKAGALLTLMMIAAGSLSIPALDARWLNGGFVEACRISLFDLIETNISMAADPTVLHSALLFTNTAAWSGDKWHMNIAMGQRGMYTAMLRHSGALEHQRIVPDASSTPDQLHQNWLQQETMSRLVYSWAMSDQDLSLFNDSTPLFSMTEFGTPMPDSDRLWHAKTAAEWSTVFSQVHEFSGGYSAVTSGVRPLSLRDMFRHFMEDDIIPRGMELTPLHLRLLLHPLQSLVCQYRQLTACFSDNISPRQQTNNVHTQSVRARLEELQVLLKRWRRLADRYSSSHPLCPLMQASLVIFHLISLNTVTNFPEIEKLARKEDYDGTYAQLMWKHKKCITDVEEAVYHAGQVIRLIKQMHANVRPPWWPAAIYRVGLIMWAESLAHNENIPNEMFSPSMEQFVAVDSLPADHPVLGRFRGKKEGRPALTRRDSTAIPIDNGFAVLSHCVEVIDEGVANRFSDGIRNKLEKLARGG
ncbi:hypothetical protein BT63DRAFT_375638 [Microthyrium microscopicum]|uniref:Transcription factor Cmr1 n=1 Tax=Microthyrium microscopicum TaxID=703497 RepID=A0A6A6U4J9_9PEZI|nr:hypothetical protein BT63DRAFT_375638 [Microthyrium microscopicum]